MIIQTIGTGSSGNAYLVTMEGAGKRLLLECGLNFTKTILPAIDFELPDVCVLSHEHGDHSKYAMSAIKYGVPIVCSNGTAGAIGIKGNHNGAEGATVRIQLLKATHNAAEPSIFLIDDKVNQERLLFATDTESIPGGIEGITHLMIEANYSKYTVDLESGHYKNTVSHMALEDAVEWVEKMDQTRLQEIRVIHISESNGHSEYFKKKMAGAAGVPVYIE